MATKRHNSKILGGMHETALGLHSAGLISKRRMGEFEALCRLDVHEMPPRKIKTLRENSHVSQAVFAAVLNTSISTVQKWETGDKKPSGSSLKLLDLIERKGLDTVIWLGGTGNRTLRRARITGVPSLSFPHQGWPG